MGSISTDELSSSSSPLQSFLDSNDSVRLIRFQYLDISSVLRCITLTTAHALRLGSSPFRLSPVALDMLPNTLFGPSFHCLGTDDLYPDWTSLRVARYLGNNSTKEGHKTATVMCLVHGHHIQFDPYYSCPRSILQNALSTAKSTHDLTFLVGCEVEFFLLDPTAPIPTAAPHSGGQYTTESLRHAPILALLEEIVFTLQDSGVHVETFHGEGEGYEISTGPLPPMQAVDELLYVRETIYTIAARRGYKATMYPFPFLLSHGVSTMSSLGAHTHFSIDNATKEVGEQFLAGLLKALPALCGFGMPSIDSYGRIGGSIGQAGVWVAYGTENKDCPIRGIANRDGYWELRFVDATSNPYLFLAAVIYAGLSGIREKLELKQLDATEDLLADMSEERLLKLGITEQLPKTLGEAMACVEKETRLEELGKDFLEKYVKTKRLEEEEYGKMGEEERKKVLGELW